MIYKIIGLLLCTPFLVILICAAYKAAAVTMLAALATALTAELFILGVCFLFK